MVDRKQSSSLLSLIASKAIVPNGIQQSIDKQQHEQQREAKRQAEEQQMMYAVRMTYLDESAGGHTHDTLFLTRKRAQKLAYHQDSVKMPTRKLENSALGLSQSQSQPQLQLQSVQRKSNSAIAASGAAAAFASATVISKKSKGLLDDPDRKLTWEPKFQAGCHFWQCIETGECRTDTPPHHESPGWGHRQGCCDEDDDNEDIRFPDCFSFLEQSRSK